MKKYVLLACCTAAFWVLSVSLGAAQQAKGKTTAKARPNTANGYHRTSNPRTRARAGAYSRYDASKRRNEGNLKLAPGLRLNMPSPPTTDYMGRPLKKPAPASGASTLSKNQPMPAQPAKKH